MVGPLQPYFKSGRSGPTTLKILGPTRGRSGPTRGRTGPTRGRTGPTEAMDESGIGRSIDALALHANGKSRGADGSGDGGC